MKTPHKHAELIKAWADGAEVQIKFYEGWRDIRPIDWNENAEFRIKPEPKPDTVAYPSVAISYEGNEKLQWYVKHKLKLTFDGETGELKSAEVL
jgi:hypothetical protein